MLCLLLAVSFAFTESVAAEVAPWSVRPWRKTMTIPKGSYKGPGEDIRLDDKAAITIGPGCAVSGAKIIVAGQAKLGLNESIFSDLTFGITLWGRLDAAKCAFDNCRMEKMETYYDTKNSSTKWRFDDCVFAGIFMRHSLLVMDCSIRAEKCTFIDLKTPAINYRNNPADEAQKDWLQFENCRFLRCEIDESFLLCTLNCQFEDCKFTGQKEWKLSKPVSVTAYISGSPMPKSYEKANLKVNFTNAVLSKKPGSSISYTYTGKKLTLPTVPVGSVAQVLGATKEVVASAPPKPAKEAAKDVSAKNLVNASVKGSSGSKPIELKKKTSAINALVVVSLAGTGEAGAASKLTALALPVSGDSVAEVTFNQPVGRMMSKSLEEVAKHLQVRYDGWPRGATDRTEFRG